MQKLLKRLACIGVAVISAVGLSQAHANSVVLTPRVPNPIIAQLGEHLFFDLSIDFTGDPTLGGGVDVQFNPAALTFAGFTFNPAFPTEALLSRQPDVRSGGILNSLAFGNSNGLTSGRVGTFEFAASGPGTSSIVLLGDGRPGDPEVIAGEFYSAVTFLPQAVSFSGAETGFFSGPVVQVVPEPETWGMMLAGLGFVAWRVRFRVRQARPSFVPA